MYEIVNVSQIQYLLTQYMQKSLIRMKIYQLMTQTASIVILHIEFVKQREGKYKDYTEDKPTNLHTSKLNNW